MFDGMKQAFENMKGGATSAALKKIAPGVVANIFNSFEALIDEVAAENEMSPYMLHVRIERKDTEVFAFVCWDDIELKVIALMDMIEEVFTNSLKQVPSFLVPVTNSLMQGMSINEVVLNNLSDGLVFLRFDEDHELMSYKDKGEGEVLLDWMKFIANAKIDL